MYVTGQLQRICFSYVVEACEVRHRFLDLAILHNMLMAAPECCNYPFCPLGAFLNAHDAVLWYLAVVAAGATAHMLNWHAATIAPPAAQQPAVFGASSQAAGVLTTRRLESACCVLIVHNSYMVALRQCCILQERRKTLDGGIKWHKLVWHTFLDQSTCTHGVSHLSLAQLSSANSSSAQHIADYKRENMEKA